ncbi:6-aminohexanoate-dimer hydrolase [Vibrio inusitatus NBRC 102082]|uniref:6-aminohexanoate-dimer hydrolase n=1 Tax=Vibrio inusitatus NBRC 102082 TaxID=1219070 RepID=A0A4Y3HRD7_9VIBR|nr:serine hydrolase [Vibrio inusitatus]GEA49491.1 6-aminohexanoate-dimer hydrolase [Vibrio inusitatus NBRC 102082]
MSNSTNDTQKVTAPLGWQELGIMQGFPAPADKQVKNTNWVWYPFNRWSFQNVCKILPVTLVKSGETIAFEHSESKDFTCLDVIRSTGESAKIIDVLESHNTDAFVVLHKGKIEQEAYYNGMNARSQHWLASMTKSFTGLAAEILISQGVIERNKRAEEYVSDLKGTAIGSATVQQILDMTAGTAWDESMNALMDENSFARQYGNAVGTWPMGGESNGVFGILPKIGMEREHGTNFVYNSPLSDAMGWVLSAATGKRFEDLMAELFWNELGAEDQAYIMTDTNTFAWTTGGLNMSARDAARFGQVMANRGQFAGKQIFPASVVESIEQGDTAPFVGSAYDERIPGGAYSSFFWLTNDEDGSYMAKGMFGQYIYINPTKDVVVVRLASPEVSSKPEFDLDMLEVFKQISNALTQ